MEFTSDFEKRRGTLQAQLAKAESEVLKGEIQKALEWTDLSEKFLSELLDYRENMALEVERRKLEREGKYLQLKLNLIQMRSRAENLDESERQWVDNFASVIESTRSGARRDKVIPIFRRVASEVIRRDNSSERSIRDRMRYADADRISVGSATMLLAAEVQRHLPLIVLEGAPGQGKSTVTQYISQVHRMRLLDRQEVLTSIPPYHREALSGFH